MIYKTVKEELKKIKDTIFDEVYEEYRGDYELFQRLKKDRYEYLEKYHNENAIEKANELIKQFLIEKYGDTLK